MRAKHETEMHTDDPNRRDRKVDGNWNATVIEISHLSSKKLSYFSDTSFPFYVSLTADLVFTTSRSEH